MRFPPESILKKYQAQLGWTQESRDFYKGQARTNYNSAKFWFTLAMWEGMALLALIIYLVVTQ